MDNHMFTNFVTHISTNLDVHILSGEGAAEAAGAAGCEPRVGSGARGAAVAPQHPPQRQLAGASLEEAKAQLQLDGDPQRWQRGPPLAFPVVAALKDLGVAQGGGRPGKELQARRSKVAFDRLGWIARLGLARQKLARLVAGSALAAGLYGTAAHVHDQDLLPTMRRWVMNALYKGSRFAQVQLFVHLVLPS